MFFLFFFFLTWWLLIQTYWTLDVQLGLLVSFFQQVFKYCYKSIPDEPVFTVTVKLTSLLLRNRPYLCKYLKTKKVQIWEEKLPWTLNHTAASIMVTDVSLSAMKDIWCTKYFVPYLVLWFKSLEIVLLQPVLCWAPAHGVHNCTFLELFWDSEGKIINLILGRVKWKQSLVRNSLL